MTETRVCRICKEEKPLVSFKEYRPEERTLACSKCLFRNTYRNNPELYRAKERQTRVLRPDRAVLKDCRKADRKRGVVSDLDLDFVREQLSQGCQYCGETEMRITLDRVNNDLGHTKSNVVPACLRCNYMRGSMPYEAWLNIIPSIRQTRELGLFGDWRSQPFNRKKINVRQEDRS